MKRTPTLLSGGNPQIAKADDASEEVQVGMTGGIFDGYSQLFAILW